MMTDSKYRIRLAKEDDVEEIADLIVERTSWLASIGTDQWSTRDQRQSFMRAFSAGHVWAVESAENIVGTFSLTTDRPDHLPHEDPPVKAMYLYKMSTLRAASGQGIGRRMVQASADIAQRQRLTVVRWDAWTTNRALHAYYDAMPGVRRIGRLDTWISGQLFELAVPAQVADMGDVQIVHEPGCG